MEEAVTLGSDAAMLTYGEYLLINEKEKAEELIQKHLTNGLRNLKKVNLARMIFQD